MSWYTCIVDSFSEKVVYRTGTHYNSTLEVVRSGTHLILDAKSVNYSFGGLHSAFRQLFRKIRLHKLNLGNVLILGFGAGSVASILQHEYRIGCRITGVEIDPEVIKIGKEYFNLDSLSNLEVIEQDANSFMVANTDIFDLVVVDLYIDKDVPVQAETSEFALLLRKSLKLNGLLIFNKWVYNIDTRKSAERLENMLISIFTDLKIYRTGHGRMNWMMVCTRID
jgi:spermidine synthase